MSSGLGRRQRIWTRRRIKRAAMLGYRKRGSIHYTQGVSRWSGIRLKRRSSKGQYPVWADCSSYVTWCYWDATAQYKIRDFVNGQNWKAGFTGTQVRYGKRIKKPALVGDLVFYGGTSLTPAHVAIYVGGGKVISHGSEAGPQYLKWNYRSVNQVRRYL